MQLQYIHINGKDVTCIWDPLVFRPCTPPLQVDLLRWYAHVWYCQIGIYADSSANSDACAAAKLSHIAGLQETNVDQHTRPSTQRAEKMKFLHSKTAETNLNTGHLREPCKELLPLLSAINFSATVVMCPGTARILSFACLVDID